MRNRGSAFFVFVLDPIAKKICVMRGCAPDEYSEDGKNDYFKHYVFDGKTYEDKGFYCMSDGCNAGSMIRVGWLSFIKLMVTRYFF